MAPALVALQQRLGYAFRQPELLTRALTHRSFGQDHNERLEFLGDAVLGLAVSSLLFAGRSASSEGDLTRVRAHLVREASLHQLALKLGLPDVMRLSEGEARDGGAQRPSILADAMEAVLGAAYLDGGYDAALGIVRQLLGATIAEAGATPTFARDPKTALQEWLQARRHALPQYRIVATRGRAHDQEFDVECAVPAFEATEIGQGRSRRSAEQAAAERMLARLTRL